MIEELITQLKESELIAVRHEELYQSTKGQWFLKTGDEIHSMTSDEADKWRDELSLCRECERFVTPNQTRCDQCEPFHDVPW